MRTGNEAILETTTGEQIALQSVHVEGRLDGLLFSTVIRQNYRNDTGKNLEIVYTFPVGWETSLLGMDMEIGGKRLRGVVIEKKEAEKKYEKALDDGDTPVMVQESSPGLYTANLGNIKAGESVSVEIRCAQLLRFEQDQVRVKIPTVIAPRYGDAHKDGGLAPHESDAVDRSARYPFTARLHIAGESARAKISSPSHTVAVAPTENGVSVLLEANAMLDRDFIVLLQGLAGHSFALSVPEEGQHTVLASFCPKLPVKAEPLALKILVDCSASMFGDSIFQAKQALDTILHELSEQDFMSFSRFGSAVAHTSRTMEQCGPEALEKFAALVRSTEADMGGTEMEKAIVSTCNNITVPENAAGHPSILLITDDLYWNDGGMLQRAMESGHRFFTVGVGSAPAECLLRQLAEKTGGACEFATPDEDMAAVIIRMFRRMRAAKTNALTIDWGSEPLWQSSMPHTIFDGDTLHLFAAFAELPTRTPTLSWLADGKTESATPEGIVIAENFDIARLGAARRMETAEPKEALSLALQYQLVSKQTSLFLVYLREDKEKMTELPTVQQVPQMMAAGSHGYGSVMRHTFASVAGASFAASDFCFTEDEFDIPCFVRQQPCEDTARSQTPRERLTSFDNYASPQDLLALFDKHALANQDYARVLQYVQNSDISDSVRNMVADFATRESLSLEQAWAVFLEWLIDRLASAHTPSRQARRLLRFQVKTFTQERYATLHASLNSRFSSVSVGAWQ